MSNSVPYYFPVQLYQLKEYIHQILDLPAEDWEAIKALFSEVSLKKEEYFAKEGAVESKFGFLTQGVMRAFYRNHAGHEYNKTFFEPFEFIGAYTSLVSRQPNRINIQTLSPCTLLVADYHEFTKLYSKHPMIERLSRLMAEYFYAIKEKREIEMALLDAGQRYELFKKEYPSLENQIAQYHIASYLSITPTQLSRIRSRK